MNYENEILRCMTMVEKLNIELDTFLISKDKEIEKNKKKKIKKQIKKCKKLLVSEQSKIVAYKNPLDLYNESFFAERKKINSWMYKWEEKMGEFLVGEYSLNSVVDFGCGTAHSLLGAYNMGAKVFGYDIAFSSVKKFIPKEIVNFVLYGDVTDTILCEICNCAISIETAEHIFPNKSENFVKNLCSSADKIIIITAAALEQTGIGHINCRSKSFWIDLFRSMNWKYSLKETDKIKLKCTEWKSPDWIINNLMFFIPN